MIEVTILIPTASNDGEEFDLEFDHFAFEACKLFGGCTRKPGLNKGSWIHDGKLYNDETISFVIAMESLTDGSKLRKLIDEAGKIFQQEAIYFSYLGQSEIVDTSHLVRRDESVETLVRELLHH